MKGRVAITPRSMSEAGHPALGLLSQSGYELVFPAPGRQPTEAELMASLPGCVGYLAGVEPVSRKVIEMSRDLRVISRNGVGIDNIDLDAARSRGIVVEKALGANTRGVAELAMALMMCGLRHVSWSDRVLGAGEWKRRKGREAFGRTLGIVGCGAIGRALAQMCLSIGMKVLGYDPVWKNDGSLGPYFRLVGLDELYAEAEIVSLHCPPGARPLVDAAAIDAMRPNVLLINTARAELIDGEALLAGLNSGKVAAFATDVYQTEPPMLNDLLRHENAIRTPHAGGLTEESVDRATRIAVENLLRVLEGHGSA
ncbi:phosphoglycerate dehydrogenase [Mesorhizobium sp. IMUNJ 23232]|uniref:phosphoglycerate dehydrogenase n=1 Tax=Mesorhizobium sp. IMUNJ 23232 TaxID=3376064 RepID=UPI00379CA055